jgi:hypothetical protein
MTVEMGDPIPLGATPYGNVSFLHATSGNIDGPRLKGELLPVGGDRVIGRTDGAQEVNVQALIRTEDQCYIRMFYQGIIRGEPLQGAENVYWRTAPMFETSAEPYLWLNGILAVGLGGFAEGRVRYEVFGLL